MSRSADRRTRLPRPPGGDAGFSLLEIVVALGVLSVVLVAMLPQLVGSIQATGTAREVSQAKGVAQGQLERMRHLPFHIARNAGDYVDVLDYYYRNRDAPASSPVCTSGGRFVVLTPSNSGYVAPLAARCAYEPATGAFYRSVTTVPTTTGLPGYTLVVSTQFLSGATPPAPVTPASTYDTQTTGKDTPATPQIGVTATVLQNRRGTIKPATAYTQIAERLPSVTRIRSEVDVRAVDVGSTTPDGVPLTLSAGLLNLTGAVSYASTAGANLAATSGALATGEQGGGAGATLRAPPAVNVLPTTSAAAALPVGGCSYACWGQTMASSFSMAADDGLPNVGSSMNPAQVLLSNTANSGLSFGNSPTSDYRPELSLTSPLLRVDSTQSGVATGLSGCGVSASGSTSRLSATGYLRSTAEDSTEEVEACAVARTTALELFPTTFAPNGVVRVELQRATARCLVQGGAHTASATVDYQAVVRYWNGSGYTTAATVAPGQAADALESVPLSTSVGGGLTVGDYVSSWSSLTTGGVVTAQANGVAQVKLPGIVKIVSQPVRPAEGASVTPTESPAPSPDPTATPEPNPTPTPDPAPEPTPDPVTAGDETSAVSVTVGALSCWAQDER